VSNTSLSRPGLNQNNTGAGNFNLFLKKFSGEVLSTFETESKLKDLCRVRTITSGESAQFPILGTAAARYHVPGESITLSTNPYAQSIGHAEKTIALDNLMVSAVTIGKIDEIMNHYDLRSAYTTELGRALAKKFDTTLAQVLTLGARAVPNFPFTHAACRYGFTLADAGFDTTAATLISGIFKVAERMDMQDVPKEDRYVVLRPKQYYLLLNAAGAAGSLLDKDYSTGNGDFAEGTVYKVAGMKVIVSNNIPSSNVAADSGGRNSVTVRGTTLNHDNTNAVGLAVPTLANIGTGTTATTSWFTRGGADAASNLGDVKAGYGTDMTNTVALCFQKEAVGTVKAMDISIESEYRMDLQAHLFVAKYAMGHNVLRPECAYELRKA